MPLPSYSDLTKSLLDLFSAGDHIGKFVVSTWNKFDENLEFIANGAHEIEDSSVTSDLLVKVNFSKFSSIAKWNSDNNVNKEISVQDLLTPGLKVGGAFQYNLDSRVKGWNALGQYKFANGTLDSSIDGDGERNNVFVNNSIVAGLRGFITGCDCKYDTGEGKIINSSSLTFGYYDPDVKYFLITVDAGGSISGSYYQQVTPNLELGLISKPNGEGGPTMDIATKYALNEVLTFRGKTNNKSEIGLGCEIHVVKGMSLFFSTAINLKEFNSGNHKFGIGLGFR